MGKVLFLPLPVFRGRRIGLGGEVVKAGRTVVVGAVSLPVQLWGLERAGVVDGVNGGRACCYLVGDGCCWWKVKIDERVDKDLDMRWGANGRQRWLEGWLLVLVSVVMVECGFRCGGVSGRSGLKGGPFVMGWKHGARDEGRRKQRGMEKWRRREESVRGAWKGWNGGRW